MARTQGARPGQTVLVVDDDRPTREVLREALEDAGYAVVEESDGGPALGLLRATPDRLVVLLNMQMPHLDGLGVLRAVAADPALAERHAYVLMTASTAVDRPDTRALLAELGVPVLDKPFHLDALLAAVDEAAERLPEDGAA